MRYILTIMMFYLTVSCISGSKIHLDDLKKGTFKTILEDKETVSFATRNDSIQIEDFQGVKDTFNIKWLDQFEYVLTKRSPKTLLDSTPFHVKIISIKENTYTFNAYYKGSNFKQKGTAIKLE